MLSFVLLGNELKASGSSAIRPALQLPFCWRRLVLASICSSGATNCSCCSNTWRWLIQAGKCPKLLLSPSLRHESRLLFCVEKGESTLLQLPLTSLFELWWSKTGKRGDKDIPFQKVEEIQFFLRHYSEVYFKFQGEN